VPRLRSSARRPTSSRHRRRRRSYSPTACIRRQRGMRSSRRPCCR
jgi:hypothetical protein